MELTTAPGELDKRTGCCHFIHRYDQCSNHSSDDRLGCSGSYRRAQQADSGTAQTGLELFDEAHVSVGRQSGVARRAGKELLGLPLE